MNSEAEHSEARDHATPVVDTERIRSLDALRGFALFGVLVMNMQAFADVFAVYMNPFAAGEISTLDFACWCVNHVLADAKFITIFSMLFGAGIVLMATRARARTGRSAGLHYRRMAWLMLFGLAHALLLWYGDILFLYGLFGLVAYWFCRLRPGIQIAIAAVLLLVPTIFLYFMRHMPAEDLAQMQDMWAPTADYVEATRLAMRGSWREQLAVRIAGWTEMLGFIVLFGWRVLACMLLGMALFTWGVFSAARSQRFYVAMIVIGFGAGLPLAAWGIYDHEACDWDMVRCMGVGSLFNYFGSLVAAFGWIGVVMLVCRIGALPELRRRLAAVGQMAFTNYIMHSVICTLIYNGHGLGLFGYVDRVWQQVLSVAIFAVQLWYSPLWLERFRFGPLEWLWRSLTYWRRQPFRRT
jgi:uncharacterized protein